MPTQKQRTIKPLEVTKPTDLPKVELQDIKPTRVEETPKPPPPDVSTTFLEELMAFIRFRIKNATRSEAEGNMVELPNIDFSNLRSNLLILGVVAIVLVLIPLVLYLFKGC